MKKILANCLVAATVFGAASFNDTCGAANQSVAAEMFRPGEIVVAGTAAQAPAGYKIKKVLPNAGLVVLEVARGQEERHVALLQGKGKKCGLNLKYQAFSAPNDPLYSYQWNMRMVQSEAAWDISTGAGVSVAILDTGLKTAGALDGIDCVDIRPQSDIVNSDSDPDDVAGHGTHVAGTVAQSTDNGVGVAGLAHGACIMPVKVLDDSGSGTSADLAEGVAFAAANGASVINMSLGWSAKSPITTDPVLDPALADAHEKGVTIVCASGNDGWSKNVSYPAISPYTIAVGAVDINGDVASYSNGGSGLDLVAPGGGNTVTGDGILQEAFDDSGWNYFYYIGTSMATPHVTAAAAMLYAENPAIKPEEVRAALTASAFDLGAAGYDSAYGHGLLQVLDALNFVGECLDGDGDSWTTCEGDCNDKNLSVNPGAAELCDDGIDNNCDGTIDEGCEEDCTDNDGDGWTTCDGDCDDKNFFANPDRRDTVGRWARDGVDNDCNGVVDK
ncbi:MAG: S8 family serine peptidase [Thermodesulfobacteriota bacterium]